MVKIADLENGYTLQYSPTQKYFSVIDKDNKEIAKGDTQDLVESKYKKYLKSFTNKNCPMNAISKDMTSYTITSFDDENNQVWATVTNCNSNYHTIGERSKHSLYTYREKPAFFKITDKNTLTSIAYKNIQDQMAELSKQAQILENSLESPITVKDFIEG